MGTYKLENEELNDTMKSHLIDDLASFGVWDDDYDTFLKKRGQKVLNAINERLHPRL